MCSHFRTSVGACLSTCFVAVFLLLGCAHAPEKTDGISTNGYTVASFKVCAEPDSLPMSQQSTNSGYEVEVAQVLANALHRTLEMKWITQRDHSFYRQTIGTGECDALMSLPSAFAKLEMTKPYYKGAYIFISRDGHATSFASIGKDTVAVPATGLGETPPTLVLSKSKSVHLLPISIFEPSSLVKAVSDRRADSAVMWGPQGRYFVSKADSVSKGALKIMDAPQSQSGVVLAYDISVGVKKGNVGLRDQLDTVLIDHRGEIDSILKKWFVIPEAS